MTEKRDTHPYLDGAKDGTSQSSVLWNTNAEFPVSGLIREVHEDDLSPGDVVRSNPDSIPDQNIAPAELETLSPFTQWLMSLSPPVYQGHVDKEPGKTARVTSMGGGEEFVEVPEKKKKKKKKGKKDKKSGRRKEAKSLISPVLDNDIITDTLAELTASQGYTEAAIFMYHKLVDLQPEKAEHYHQRIRELKQRAK